VNVASRSSSLRCCQIRNAGPGPGRGSCLGVAPRLKGYDGNGAAQRRTPGVVQSGVFTRVLGTRA